MTRHQWKLEALAKRIDPELAVQELKRIEEIYGSLTPENVIKASVPPDSILHELFEWDDELAGHKYRLQQARTIINNIEVVTVTDNEPIIVSKYEIVTVSDGRAYKSYDVMSPDDIMYVRTNTVRELKRLKEKMKFYDDLKAGVHHIEMAIESIT